MSFFFSMRWKAHSMTSRMSPASWAKFFLINRYPGSRDRASPRQSAADLDKSICLIAQSKRRISCTLQALEVYQGRTYEQTQETFTPAEKWLKEVLQLFRKNTRNLTHLWKQACMEELTCSAVGLVKKMLQVLWHVCLAWQREREVWPFDAVRTVYLE